MKKHATKILFGLVLVGLMTVAYGAQGLVSFVKKPLEISIGTVSEHYVDLSWTLDGSKVRSAFVNVAVAYENLANPIPDAGENFEKSVDLKGFVTSFSPFSSKKISLFKAPKAVPMKIRMSTLSNNKPYLKSIRSLFDRDEETGFKDIAGKTWKYCIDPTKAAYPKASYPDDIQSRFCHGTPNREVSMSYANIFIPISQGQVGEGKIRLSSSLGKNVYRVFYRDQLNDLRCRAVTVKNSKKATKVIKDISCS